MANRYWVGGTGSWNGTATGKWATTSGGASGAAEPTASDDVFFDGASGAVTVTVATSTRVCRSINFTGFTGTFTGSTALNVGTTTAGNITLVSGMTWSYTGALSKISSGTCTLTTAGKKISSFTNSGTGTLTLGDNALFGSFTCSGTNTNNFNSKTIGFTGSFTLAAGTTVQNPSTITYTGTGGGNFSPAAKTLGDVVFNGTGTLNLVAGFTCGKLEILKGTAATISTTTNCTYFTSTGTQTRGLSLGSSAILNVTGVDTAGGNDVAWDLSSPTGFTLTLNAGTQINFTAVGAQNFYGGGKSYGNVAFTGGGLYGYGSITGANTFGTLTLNKLYQRIFTGATTCTNLTADAQTAAIPNAGAAAIMLQANLTVSGTITLTGSATTRMFLVNTPRSPAITVTCNGTWTCQYLDIAGITGAGSASRNLSAITGLSGDAGSNSGFTFTSPITAYWYQNAGNWYDTSKWFLGTGGSGGSARVPLPQDTMVFDANSFSTSGQVVVFDNLDRMATFSASAVTNNPEFASTYGITVHSDLTLGTLTWSAAQTTFAGTSAATIYCSTASITSSQLTVNKIGGSLTLGSNLSYSSGFLGVIGGTFNTSSYNLSATLYAFTAGTANLGSGTHNVVLATDVGGTINQQTSTINLLSYSYTAGTMSLTSANILAGADTNIEGVLTLTTLNVAPASVVVIGNGNTLNITNFNAVGTSGNLISFRTFNTGIDTWTLNVPSGVVASDYLNLADSIGTGGATFYAGSHSTNSGNNTGWSFTDAPPPGSVASASGSSTVSGVGKNAKKALGSAAGIAAGAATGSSKRAAIGSSAGAAAGGAIGRAKIPAVASSAGTSTASGSGRSSRKGVGSSVGTSTVAAVSRIAGQGVAASTGTSTVSGVGRSLKKSTASTSGVSAVVGIGASKKAAAGASAGVATAAATGKTARKTVGSTAGISTATATGKSLNKSTAAATGVSTPAAIGAAKFKATGATAGLSSAAGIGKANFKGVAQSAGVSTAQAVGKNVKKTVGTSAGISVVAAFSITGKKAVAAATGAATVAGTGKTGKSMVGSAAGTSTAAAVGRSNFLAVAHAEGHATVTSTTKFHKNLYVPKGDFILRSGANRFGYSVIKFSGEPVPVEHMEDAQKLEADAYIDLFQIVLSDRTSKLYLKMNHDVTWQGNTYEGTGIKIDGVATYASEEVSRPKLSIFNPEGVYSALVDDGLLDGAKVIRYRVLKEDVDNDRPIYRAQQWKISRVSDLRVGAIVFELRDLMDGQTFMVPYRMFIPPDFPTVSIS